MDARSMMSRRPGAIWPFLVFFGAAAAPFSNAVLSLRIPLMGTEAALVLAVLAALALLAAVVTVRLPRAVQALLYAVAILCFVDVSYGGNNLASSAGAAFQWFATERWGRLLAIAAFLAGTYAAAYRLGENAPKLIGAVVTAVLLSTVLIHQLTGPSAQWASEPARARVQAPSGAPADRPVVVVLLLDELMAVGALPEAGAPAELAALKQRIFRFHDRHGFRLHTRAYSRHYWTQYSISDLLNFNYVRTSKAPAYTATPDARHRMLRLTENRLFSEFAGRGYAIDVFQTDNMHFCGDPGVTFCATLDSYNPLSRYSQAGSMERHGIVIGAALRAIANSYVVNTLLERVALLRDAMLSIPSRIDVQAFKPWFAGIKQRVLASSPGTLVFAHVMVPHAPYMLNDDCSITYNTINPYRLAERPGEIADAGAAYRENYQRYFRQVNCLYSQLEDLFEQVGSRPGLRNATFIISGDHGSRIAKSNFAGSMDERDMIDNYAAHFSVKGPAVAAGVDQSAIALQRLFAEAFDPSLKAGRYTEAERSVLADVKDSSELALIGLRGFASGTP